MPNQRAKDKAFLGVFLDQKTKESLVHLAAARGETVTGLVTHILSGYLQNTSAAPETGTHARPAEREAAPASRPSAESIPEPAENIWML